MIRKRTSKTGAVTYKVAYKTPRLQVEFDALTRAARRGSHRPGPAPKELASMQDQRTAPGLCECGCGRQTEIATRTSTQRGTVKGQPNRFIKGHHIAVYNRVAKRKPGPRYIVDENGCWVWQLYINPKGYAMVSTASGKSREAHRIYYEQYVGPIPDGLVIDHLCRNRACVNPSHLEPVTIKENVLRGEGAGAKYARRTHCAKGHPFSGDNLYVTPSGARRCRTCRREREASR